MTKSRTDTTASSVAAGVLSWLLPGAGHYWLGHRGLAIVCFVAITFPYWVGLAFGGVLASVNPRTNRWLFLAEMGVGGYTLGSLVVSQSVERTVLASARLSHVPDALRSPAEYAAYLEAATRAGYMSYYPAADVAQIYLATAGLLNLLVILDAVSRAQTGLPTFQRELAAVGAEAG